MSRRVSDDKIQQIAELRDKGLTYKKISEITGVSLKYIYSQLNASTKNDIKVRNEKILELRKQNLSHQEIADIVGCHRQTVGRFLKQQEGYINHGRIKRKQ